VYGAIFAGMKEKKNKKKLRAIVIKTEKYGFE
jgi:hypothetical protein